ncbi:MAG TPA: hypothetical protein VHC69_31615 [Polyangiaceae bacterium]|nr:hypothetical protein [Polyangiaceae bacterium]
MDPRQAAAIRLANEARSDAEAGPIFSHMAYHMRKSVGREGAALTPEQQNEDIAAFEAADPSTLKPEHAAEANRLAGLLRARGWDAHR